MAKPKPKPKKTSPPARYGLIADWLVPDARALEHGRNTILSYQRGASETCTHTSKITHLHTYYIYVNVYFRRVQPTREVRV